MEIVPVVDEGLGNSSYVVALGDGAAAVVDPFRDPAPYLAVAEQRGWRVRYAVETHLHADFVSGSRELAAGGAQVLASAGAPPEFPATLVEGAQEVDLGGLTLRALPTPGHTTEHLSYLLLEGTRPLAVFTGGTLIVGGAARPDLLGPELTEPLARAAYESIQTLLRLPDDLPVYPTHGPGSFCSTGAGSERTTTIGAERKSNPLLQAHDEEEFVSRLLGGLGTYPPYFLELRAVNQAGPAVVGPDPGPPAQLDVRHVRQLMAQGAELVDVRHVESFAGAHIPGSLSIAFRPEFATWLGWLVDRRAPLVFVADDTVDRRELLWACLGIGFEQVAGEVAGGIAAWEEAGGRLRSIPLLAPTALPGDVTVLDVRQQAEWDEGHVPGAVHLELGDLDEHGDGLGARTLATHCGHGERAMTAASILARAGHGQVVALTGGPEDIADALGLEVERPT